MVRARMPVPGRRSPRRRPRGTSRAAWLLREAPITRCEACGRMTATTTDGACADCWARKVPAPGQPGAPAALPSLREVLRSLVTRRR